MSDIADILDKKILSALTKYEFKVFALYMQDISYKNIAEILGKNIKSIDNAICRIKSKLRQINTVKYNN
jgi:RNA polymerase sporulation-specific sigma factor